MNRVFSHLANALVGVAAVATLAMMLHIVADVLGKYFANQPIPATLEIVTWYYMVAAIFLPVAYVQLHRKHLMVELFTQTMSPQRVAGIEIISSFVSLLYVGSLFWLTLRTAIHETARGEAQDATYFDLIVWPSRWILPFSLGLTALILGWQIVQNCRTALGADGADTSVQN